MIYIRKFFQIIVLTLLFSISFSIIDLFKGSDIDYFNNLVKAACSICVMGVCKLLYYFYKHYQEEK